MPVDAFIGFEHGVFERARGQIPTRLAPVDEGGGTTPAVRQGVRVRHALEEATFGFERIVNGGVCRPNFLAFKPRDVLREGAVRSNWIKRRQAVRASDLAVNLTKGR